MLTIENVLPVTFKITEALAMYFKIFKSLTGKKKDAFYILLARNQVVDKTA